MKIGLTGSAWFRSGQKLCPTRKQALSTLDGPRWYGHLPAAGPHLAEGFELPLRGRGPKKTWLLGGPEPLRSRVPFALQPWIQYYCRSARNSMYNCSWTSK